MSRSFYARRAWPILIVSAALWYPVYLGKEAAMESSNNNIHQWLPQEMEATSRYHDFCRVFGSEDFALVSWEGCTLDDERLEEFANRVVPPEGQRGDDETKWFSKVLTGPRLLADLTQSPYSVSQSLRHAALKRLEGTLVGPDHKTTGALVILSEEGNADRTAALDALKKIARKCGIEGEDLRLGGDTVINAAIDLESKQAIEQWTVLSFAVALAVAWLCLRSLKLVVMIFVVAVYASDLGTSAIYFTGGTMNLVLVVVPVLLYVLTLSAAVHLSNYYRDEVRQSGPAGAPLRAVAAGWTPCALSAITTALGLVSLYVSRIVPVRMFGIYSALGILLGVGLMFLLLPAGLEKWPVGAGPAAARAAADSRRRALDRLANLTIRHRRGVMAICLAALLFSSGGVALVDTTVAPSRFFPPDSKWVRDSLWLQEHLGPMIPIEVVVHFDKRCPMNMLQRMELVGKLEEELKDLGPIGGTISPATFAPVLSNSMGMVERFTVDERLKRNRQQLIDTGYLHVDEQEEQWRISARVRAFSGIDHDKFLREIERRVDAILEDRAQVPAPQTVSAVYTGIVPLVYHAQRELLDGLFKSFCLAFVMIAVVMLMLLLHNCGVGMLQSFRSFLTGILRAFAAGMLVMLPNVFPAVVTFGSMGWTGNLIDVGAMMTASVALGIAVDDTLHFLTWFRRALQGGRSRHQAIVEAFGRCAPAMTQTTLIAGLGLLVFWRSSFQPVSQFGLLMFVLLAAALVGDLIFLPAMLATRLGKLFE